MQPEIDFNNLLISTPYGSEDVYESVEGFESYFPWIRELEISFVLESEKGELQVLLYDEKQNVKPAGVMSGTLILGKQAFLDEKKFAVLCDDYSADLCVVATELEKLEYLVAPLVYTLMSFPFVRSNCRKNLLMQRICMNFSIEYRGSFFSTKG